jgi:hypothetical protein
MAVTMLLMSVLAWPRCAAIFALASAGKIMAAKIPMMAMTTSNSMSVNPALWLRRL